MKWSILVLVVIGIAGAFFAAFLAANLKQPPPPPPPPVVIKEPPPPPKEATIVVAKMAMPAMTVIGPGMVGVQKVPAERVGLNSIAYPSSIIGKVLVAPVLPQQELTKNCFASEGSGLQLSAILPARKRAITIALDDYAGMEGLLYPGSIVDVLVSLKMGSTSGQAVSTTLLRAVQVLAVGSKTVLSGDPAQTPTPSAETTSRGRSLFVTVMVEPKQAQALQLAMEHGRISLSMRNPSDAQNIKDEPTLLTQLCAEYAAWVAKTQAAEIAAREVATGAVRTSTTQPTTVPATQPAPTPAAPAPPKIPTWATTVIRGSQTDVQTFRLRPEK